MKWFWKWLLVTAAMLVSVSGCVAASDKQDRVDPPPVPERREDSTGGEQADDATGVAVSVSVSPDAWLWIAEHTPEHSITFNKAIAVKDSSGVAVAIPAGTTAAIQVTGQTAEVSFSKPFPEASRFGVKLHIKSIQLKQDGSGVARTAIKDWKFRWADEVTHGSGGEACSCGCGKSDCGCTRDAGDPPAAAVAGGRRRVWVFTATWCGPCETLHRALKGKGATLGETDEFDVRFIDVEKHPDLWGWYEKRDNSIPQAALFIDDKLQRTVPAPTVEDIIQHVRGQK